MFLELKPFLFLKIAIGGIIGKGGETIQAIQAETNTSIGIGDAEDGMAMLKFSPKKKKV